MSTSASTIAATATRKLQTFTPVPEPRPAKVLIGVAEVAEHPWFRSPCPPHLASFRGHHCCFLQLTDGSTFFTSLSQSTPPSSSHATAFKSAATSASTAGLLAAAAWSAFMPA